MINIPTIGIIDTGTSNIQSVTYALKEATLMLFICQILMTQLKN